MFPMAIRASRGLPAILRGPVPLPKPKRRRVRHLMTVGIGVACQRGACVVMAADGKGSFADGQFTPHERIGKQIELPFGLCGNIAGTVSICHAFMSRLYTALERHTPNTPLSLEYLLRHVEAARYAEFQRFLDGEM